MKEASTKVIADASATVFDTWCPKASSKLQNFSLLTKDVIAKASNKTAEACGGKPTGLLGALLPGVTGVLAPVTQQQLVTDLLTSHAPLKQKFAEVLNEAKKCGCPPSLCLFCSPADTVN